MAYWGVNQQQMISVEVCILSEAFSLHTNVINTCIYTYAYIYIYLDLPKGAKWFLKGVNLASLRV